VREGTAKLVAVGSHSADILIGGKKSTLLLETASSLVLEAIAKYRQEGSVRGNSIPSFGTDTK
jgi:hypothetical protein